MNEMICLACSVCKERNYNTTKNKKTHAEKLKLKKFCPRCQKHTEHVETK